MPNIVTLMQNVTHPNCIRSDLGLSIFTEGIQAGPCTIDLVGQKLSGQYLPTCILQYIRCFLLRACSRPCPAQPKADYMLWAENTCYIYIYDCRLQEDTNSGSLGVDMYTRSIWDFGSCFWHDDNPSNVIPDFLPIAFVWKPEIDECIASGQCTCKAWSMSYQS